MTLSDAELREIFDQEMRRGATFPDTIREETAEIVRYCITTEPQMFISYSCLTADRADAVIAEQIAFARESGRGMEWKLYSYDQPADLGFRLQAQGFQPEEPEALMVLDANQLPPALQAPMRHDIRRLTKPEQVQAVIIMKEQLYGEDFTWLQNQLNRDLVESPDRLELYGAYADGILASSAWIYFHPGTRFASLWGGSTLPAYRGQGLYTALIAVRVLSALQQGYRFWMVDASPMSRPILEKHGFRCLGFSTPYNWSARGASPKEEEWK